MAEEKLNLDEDIDEILKRLDGIKSNLSQDKERESRFTRASYFELAILVVVFLFVFLSRFVTIAQMSGNLVIALNDTASEGIVSGTAVLLFFEVFFFLISRKAMGALLVSSYMSIFTRSRFGVQELSTLQSIDVAVKSEKKSEPASVLDEIFREQISRSQKAVDISQRRPNVLIFVGTTIAVLGLLFFILTLPGSSQPNTSAEHVPADSSVAERVISITPRLLMLLFIQVLAGFFLKQYRSSMEEFRYYETLLRLREAQFLSFKIKQSLNDNKMMAKFSDVLLESQNFDRIKKDETTAIMQAHREEANEFDTMVDKMFDIRKTFSKVRKSPILKPKTKIKST